MDQRPLLCSYKHAINTYDVIYRQVGNFAKAIDVTWAEDFIQ